MKDNGNIELSHVCSMLHHHGNHCYLNRSPISKHHL